MDAMIELAARRGFAMVCDGTNASDPGPNRPGLKAIEEHGVYSPLLAHGIDKAGTRAARSRARALGLGSSRQRLSLVAHSARPGRDARQAAHDRGGGGPPPRARLRRRSRPPRRRPRARRGRPPGAAASARPWPSSSPRSSRSVSAPRTRPARLPNRRRRRAAVSSPPRRTEHDRCARTSCARCSPRSHAAS